MSTPLSPVEPWSHIIRLAGAPRIAQSFEISPPPETREVLAHQLDLSALRKLRFKGVLSPEGNQDWRLKAQVGATLVQPCVVTFAPVTTRIDEHVERRYLADIADLPDSCEIEMPDDEAESLPTSLDLGAVMLEALSLAIPAWPRAGGATLERRNFAAPGTTPMTDEDARPFAGLGALVRSGKEET